MEESIYNIIPKEYNPPAKGPIYKSKYPPNIPPTGSTFTHHTTSVPGIANLAGNFETGLQPHTQFGATKTLGHLKGDRKPSPDAYLKKHTGTMGNQTLPQPQTFSYECQHKKPPVPSPADKPAMGLKSDKNFVVTNAIENILSVAKKTPQDKNWLEKKDYGKTPQYLEKIKDNIQSQYRMIQNLHQQSSPQKNALSEEQVKQLREGLKRKWDEINKEYQKITHIRTIDTLGLKTKKQKYEKELAEIEADIKKLNKQYIFVE